MTTALIVLTALALAAVIAETVREVLRDGPSPQGPPRSHLVDPHTRPPGEARK